MLGLCEGTREDGICEALAIAAAMLSQHERRCWLAGYEIRERLRITGDLTDVP